VTLYNPILDTSPTPPGSLATDATSYIFGLSFTVSLACQINGIWWWCSTGQYTNTGADEQISLWITTGPGPVGSYVAGSVASAGTYTQNAWNLISFGSPISLTPGTEYLAQKGVSSFSSSNSYSTTSLFFGSGPGTNGFSEGPVLVYSGLLSDGATSNLEPFGTGQQTFSIGPGSSHPPNVTTNQCNSSFHSTWYGMDIQIQTGAAPPATTITTYSMRLS
jgi:hypothetical protein